MYIHIEEAFDILLEDAKNYSYIHPIEIEYIRYKKENIETICFYRKNFSFLFQFYINENFESCLKLYEVRKPSCTNENVLVSHHIKDSPSFSFAFDHNLLFKFLIKQFKKGLYNYRNEYNNFVNDIRGKV